MKTILVLNMGMKSIRSIIFNDAGKKLSSAAKPIKTAINDNHVEQDPNEWWNKAIEVMSKSIYDAKINNIDFITVTTSASCLVCINSDGQAIGNALMVSDKRAHKQAKEIEELNEFKDVYKQTKLAISTSLMLPKIYWVKKNKPNIFENTAYFLCPNDYLIFKLCGEIVTDYLNAIKCHYDIVNNTYPTILLKKLGVDQNKLPKVLQTGVQIGNISTDIANKIGIKTNTKVILTSYDAICSFIGSGVNQEGDASDVSGTVTVFRMLSKHNNLSSNKVYITPFIQDNSNIIGGSNNLGGGLIEWVKQCYYLKEEYPYEVMEREACESDVGARGIIFLPYLLGERAPIWNDNVRGMFFGLERMHTRKDMTRAVFESAAFIDMSFIEEISKMGVEVNSVRISGGLARINTVSQIKADVLNKDILVLSEFETTATGAAMIALHGQGVFKSLKEAADKFATIRMIIKPNEENHQKYMKLYQLFKEIYEVNKDLFKKRIDILESIRTDRDFKIENL